MHEMLRQEDEIESRSFVASQTDRRDLFLESSHVYKSRISTPPDFDNNSLNRWRGEKNISFQTLSTDILIGPKFLVENFVDCTYNVESLLLFSFYTDFLASFFAVRIIIHHYLLIQLFIDQIYCFIKYIVRIKTRCSERLAEIGIFCEHWF